MGHSITFKVYSELTQSILFRSSCVKKIQGPLDINRKLAPPDSKPGGDDKDKQDRIMFGSDVPGAKYTGFNPEDLIDRSFLMEPGADRMISRAKIVDFVEEFQEQVERSPEHVKFKCRVGSKYDEFIAYK